MTTIAEMLPGLTADQSSAIEAALLMVHDPAKYDGLRQALVNALGAGPTYDNSTVKAAISSVLQNYSEQNIPVGILFPS